MNTIVLLLYICVYIMASSIRLIDYISGGIRSRYQDMKYEALRFGSFVNFPPNSPVSAAALSKAGFYYTETDDEVQCFSCDFKIKDLLINRNPIVPHNFNSPNCAFIKGKSDNVPMGYHKETIDSESLVNSIGITDDVQRSQNEPNIDAKSKNNVPDNIVDDSIDSQNSVAPSKTNCYSQNTYDDYRYERTRLNSFRNWPSNAGVTPDDLAKSGFYYTGSDDRAQCVFCRGILRNWEPDDKPEAEHRRHFGQCPFLLNPFDVGNITLGNEERTSTVDFFPGIITERPVHERYALPQERLASFKDYTARNVQTPETFTRAGFFYGGVSDHVKCFFCDGGLRNWEPNDDPWTEHARWFPRCGFLRLCKGDEFIQQVKDKFAPRVNCSQTRIKHIKKRNKKKVEKGKLDDYMRSDIVRSVLEMGYDEEKVSQVVIHRIQDLGDDFFPNTESLLDGISEYEEELKYIEVYGELTDSQNDSEESDANVVENIPKKREENISPKSKSKKKNKKRSNAVNKQKRTGTPTIGENSGSLQYMDDVEAKQMTEDIQRMKDERLCKVCLDEEANIVFLKCGHLVCCSNCAPVMRHCPICRQTIRGTIRVFAS